MNPNSTLSSDWYLEGFVGDSSSARHIPINVWPFRIGRQSNMPCCLPSGAVSKEHAEIRREGAALWLRDLGSRNGTFVNGTRIAADTQLNSGDLLHFANIEFRLGCRASALAQSLASAGATMQVDRSEWILSVGQFEKLFEAGGARPHFQPIVELGGGRVVGYEVLARSDLAGLQNPKKMFDVAARLESESRLSRLFQRLGVEIGQQLPGSPNLFLNTHPAELDEPELLEGLTELRALAPGQELTLEIHEAAVTNVKRMRELRSALNDLHIKIAYDDFGAGQARLLEVIEIPPDFLKFDICLVREIHKASVQRRQTLESLVRMTHDLGVVVLAEGIECQEEGDVCTQVGFDLAQGYHYGRPADVAQFCGAVTECCR